jgi:hypothetical protein
MPRRARTRVVKPALGTKRVGRRSYHFYYTYLYIPKRLGEKGELVVEYDEENNQIIIKPAPQQA